MVYCSTGKRHSPFTPTMQRRNFKTTARYRTVDSGGFVGKNSLWVETKRKLKHVWPPILIVMITYQTIKFTNKSNISQGKLVNLKKKTSDETAVVMNVSKILR